VRPGYCAFRRRALPVSRRCLGTSADRGVTAGQAVRLERRAKPGRPAQQGPQGRPDRPAPPARLEHQGIPGRRAQPDRRTRGTPLEAEPDHLPRPIRRSRPSPFRQGTTCSGGRPSWLRIRLLRTRCIASSIYDRMAARRRWISRRRVSMSTPTRNLSRCP